MENNNEYEYYPEWEPTEVKVEGKESVLYGIH
jgi:hypothetical protein